MVDAVLNIIAALVSITLVGFTVVSLVYEFCSGLQNARTRDAVSRTMTVERPAWADRGSAEIRKQALQDGTTVCSVTAAFAFGDTKKDYIQKQEPPKTPPK